MGDRATRRIAAVSILAVLIAYPFALTGVSRSLATMRNAPILWIPESFPAVQVFRSFLERFDSLEAVLVSWDGATVDDARLAKIAQNLQALESTGERQQQPRYAGFADGYSQLRSLIEPPLELSRAVALRRLRGSLVGPDGQASCAAIFLTEHGSTDRERSLEEIVAAAEEASGLPSDHLYIAGTMIDGIAIDRLSSESLNRYAAPSILISFLICWYYLRSLWFTLPLLLIAGFGQALCLSLVYYSGSTMNAVLIVLPTLVFVLTISAGIHLTNYFYAELRVANDSTAAGRAMRRAWGPSSLAVATTVIGLLSLLVSDVEPVRQFGWLGASGVVVCFALLFLILPGVMQWWQLRHRQIDFSTTKVGQHAGYWGPLTRFVNRMRFPLILGSLLLMGTSAWGLRHLTTSVDVMALLDPDVRAVSDSRWFKQNIGPLVPVDLVLTFPPECESDLLDRVKLVTDVHRAVAEPQIVDGIVSAATFLPAIPRFSGIRATINRSVMRNRIDASRAELHTAGVLVSDEDGEHWRISMRADGHAGIDYSELLAQVQAQADPLVQQFNRDEDTQVTTLRTGVLSAVNEVQKALLVDLFSSYITALALVGAVMVVALRGFVPAFLAMLPNMFPTFLLFGTLGWIGRPVDIGTVMTASVAFGIAVDGTFHYLATFRAARQAGDDWIPSLLAAYRHCGKALFQTTVVCALGVLVYGFSDFLPARYFTWAFILVLIMATVGDLVLLPAILASPLGRFFRRYDRMPRQETPAIAGGISGPQS